MLQHKLCLNTLSKATGKCHDKEPNEGRGPLGQWARVFSAGCMGLLRNIHQVAGVVGLGRHYDAFELTAPVNLRGQVALTGHEGVAKLGRAFECDNNLCSYLCICKDCEGLSQRVTSNLIKTEIC